MKLINKFLFLFLLAGFALSCGPEGIDRVVPLHDHGQHRGLDPAHRPQFAVPAVFHGEEAGGVEPDDPTSSGGIELWSYQRSTAHMAVPGQARPAE